MKLNKLRAHARAQCRTQSASAEVMAPATVKQPVRATKVRRQERATVSAPVLKAVRCRCTEESRREVSTISSLRSIVAINLNALNAFEDGAVVDQAALVEAGIIKSACDGVKVLSNGALTKKVTVKANAFSEAAKAKIEAAGGKAEVI